MFTGIVTAVGELTRLELLAGDLRIRVAAPALAPATLALGDSVAVAGVCLTVTDRDAKGFSADVSAETLARTSFGELKLGRRLNLERALRAGDALGGHYVSGHVDGVGRIRALVSEARSLRVVVGMPRELARYVATKGSITVDGVSLTVNEISGDEFGVNLVPHTREVTTLGALALGESVNLEVDLVARYLERLVAGGAAPGAAAG
jgi:riboflavin synthase